MAVLTIGSTTEQTKLDSAGNTSLFPHDVTFQQRLLQAQGADLASANNLSPGSGNLFYITGTTTINLINSSNYTNGSEITLVFSGLITIAHNVAVSGNNKPILLNGAGNFDAVAGDTLTLKLLLIGSDQFWYETSRALSGGTVEAKLQNVRFVKRYLGAQPGDIASANNLTLTDGNTFIITGTTQINIINGTNWTTGSEIVLVFTGNVTVAHNQTGDVVSFPILLSSGANFSATTNDNLTLRLVDITGTFYWIEISRTVI